MSRSKKREWTDKRSGWTRRARWYEDGHNQDNSLTGQNIRLHLEQADLGEKNHYPKDAREAEELWQRFRYGSMDAWGRRVPRQRPSVAYGLDLTALERDVLRACYLNEYHDNGDNYHPSVWSWSVTSNCRVCSESQVSGVVSSLVQKGVLACCGEGDERAVSVVSDAAHKYAYRMGWWGMDGEYVDHRRDGGGRWWVCHWRRGLLVCCVNAERPLWRTSERAANAMGLLYAMQRHLPHRGRGQDFRGKEYDQFQSSLSVPLIPGHTCDK